MQWVELSIMVEKVGYPLCILLDRLMDLDM